MVSMEEIQKRFKDEIPELRDIFFTRRPPLAPWSSEVDEWISMLRKSYLIITYLMPPYHDIEMDVDQRKHIVGRNRQRLRRYKPQIEEMAAIFNRYLTPSIRD